MKALAALIAIGFTSVSPAETTYLGMYLQGSKIGYASYTDRPDTLAGVKLTRSDSHTVLDAELMGTTVKMVTDSTTWTTAAGRPVRMNYLMESAGRKQTLTADFEATNVLVDVDNGGAKNHYNLTIPHGVVVDDPLTLVLHGQAKPGETHSFYVLDPSTVSFIKNDIKMIGASTTTIRGKSVNAIAIDLIDPRASMRVYVTKKGDLVRVDGPMGIDMVPESKAVALAKQGKYAPTVDLAIATSLKTDKPIDDPAHLKGLTLRISGKDLSHIPSNTAQSVSPSGEGWKVVIRPIPFDDILTTPVSDLANQQAEWLKPSLDIPSGSERFKELAKKIVGPATDVRSAAMAIRKYVYDTMQPNAGIGVLRDASEILDSKQGVCRDYAMLTTTLLRAAGIPARLGAGLVNWDGSFYYHAWAQAWDGQHWFGVDSTTPDNDFSASHVTLAQGNVDDAFTFTFLDKAHVEVLDAKH